MVLCGGWKLQVWALRGGRMAASEVQLHSVDMQENKHVKSDLVELETNNILLQVICGDRRLERPGDFFFFNL